MLAKFQAVIFLDQDASQRREVIRYITPKNAKLDLPQKTNNPLSQKNDSKIYLSTLHYEKTFMKLNALDYEFYNWAKSQFTSENYMKEIRSTQRVET